MSKPEIHQHPDVHEQRTAAAERRIESHLKHHPHNLEPVFHELHALRKLEGGVHFHQDLEAINKKLEEHKLLPHMRIVEKGDKDFDVVKRDDVAPPNEQPHRMRGFDPTKYPAAATLPEADMNKFMRHLRHNVHSGYQPHNGSEGSFSEVPRGHRSFTPSAEAPSKTGFAQALLEKLGLPVTPENLAFLDAWQKAEGGSLDNPFNTSQKMPGATVFNGDGVRRYPSMEVGLEATAKTLSYPRYRGIIEALRHSDAIAAANALEVSPWGTHGIRSVLRA